MPRTRVGRALSMRPINTVKHYEQRTLTTLGAASSQTDTVVDAVSIRTTSNIEVLAGSHVKNLFIERWIVGEAKDNIFGLAVIKLPSDLAAPTFAQLTNLNDYLNKKNILYVTYGTISSTNPVPVIRQWIKNPKSRMGLGDRIVVSIWSQAIGLDYCGFSTYKEYT